MSKPGPKPDRDIGLRITTEKLWIRLVMFDPFKTKLKEPNSTSRRSLQ